MSKFAVVGALSKEIKRRDAFKRKERANMIPKDYYFSRDERSMDVYLHGVRIGRVHEIAVFDYWDILCYANLNWGVEEILSKKNK